MGTGGVFLRKLRATVNDEPTGFVWIEDKKLAASGYPASRKQVEWLASSGIACILSLTEDPLPQGWVAGLDLTLGHVPLVDHAPPTVADLERCTEFIGAQLARGQTVLVHCLAGEGRTGCVLAGYLMKNEGYSPEKALAILRGIKGAFVESSQEKSLETYYQFLHRVA